MKHPLDTLEFTEIQILVGRAKLTRLPKRSKEAQVFSLGFVVELKPDTYIHKADSAQMWHLASIILAKKDPSNKVYLTCRTILESKSNIFRY